MVLSSWSSRIFLRNLEQTGNRARWPASSSHPLTNFEGFQSTAAGPSVGSSWTKMNHLRFSIIRTALDLMQVLRFALQWLSCFRSLVEIDGHNLFTRFYTSDVLSTRFMETPISCLTCWPYWCLAILIKIIKHRHLHDTKVLCTSTIGAPRQVPGTSHRPLSLTYFNVQVTAVSANANPPGLEEIWRQRILVMCLCVPVTIENGTEHVRAS